MNKISVYLRAPVMSLSGYGVHSRQILDYLLSDNRFEVFLDSVKWGMCPYIHDDERIGEYYKAIARYSQMQEFNDFDICIHVTIPNEFTRRGKVCIGVTAGIEVDRVSVEWIQKCNEMDMIVVPSEFSKGVMTSTVAQWKNRTTNEEGNLFIQTPIFVIPEWFDRPDTEGEELGVEFSTSKNLLFVGQWGTKGKFHEDRKDIANLIKLFCETFKNDPDAGLVLKTNLISNSIEDFSHTERRIKEIKSNFPQAKCKIHLIHDTLSVEQMYMLYRHPGILGLISLTHGEGYGLPLLESHATGLPVLATGWSGHMDFLRSGHGFLPIDYSMKVVPECQLWDGVIIKGSEWAYVDDDHASRRMKKFLNASWPIRKAAEENVQWLDENFSKEAVMKKWKDFFDTQVFGESSKESSAFKTTKESVIESLGSQVEKNDKEKVLFVLPRSFGDVAISTAIVDALLERHADCDFYYATDPSYFPILEELADKRGVKVINYVSEMMSVDLTNRVWDHVYNPGINVQYNFSGWLNGNGEYSVRLMEEFAKACNVHGGQLKNYVLPQKEVEKPAGSYIVITPVTSKQSKTYRYWDDVITNIKAMLPDTTIVQLGTKSEKFYDGTLDCRGLTYPETFNLIAGATLSISPDTGTAHVAAAFGIPHIVLFGSTHPNTCSPMKLDKESMSVYIESAMACKHKCYKDSCTEMPEGKNCLSHISPQTICLMVKKFVEKINEKGEKEAAE